MIRRSGNSNPEFEQRRAHALARLLHRGVGQADDRERRQARMDVGLDRHGDAVHAEQREGEGTCEHAGTVGRVVSGDLAQLVTIQRPRAEMFHRLCALHDECHPTGDRDSGRAERISPRAISNARAGASWSATTACAKERST